MWKILLGILMALTITKEPVNPCFSKNIIAFQAQTDSGLPVKARVFFETAPYSDTYEFLVELKAIPDSDGYCVFYLHGLLESDVLRYDKPNFAAVAQVMQKSCRRFKIDFYEYDSTALELFTQALYTGSSSFQTVNYDALSAGTDYVLYLENPSIYRTSNNLAVFLNIISSSEVLSPLYQLGDLVIYELNPAYNYDKAFLYPGETLSIYTGDLPTIVTSSVRFAILGGIEYERFNLLTENYLLWGDENYDLIIDSNGNFIGVS